MLRDLQIKNFITIDEQAISFDNGLHVFTGETGAGKSVVLSALEIVLGGRASPKLIRQGETDCFIDAIFDLSSVDKKHLANLPEIAQQEELSVSRSFNLKGRGKVYINGRLSTVAQLSEISQSLINICSQGHHMELLREKTHVDVLDEFAGLSVEATDYLKKYECWKSLKDQVEDLQRRAEEAARRSSEIEFIIKDLSDAGVGKLSRDDLEQDLARVSSAETLLKLTSSVDSGLSLTRDSLDKVVAGIEKISGLDASQEEILNRVNSLSIELSELRTDLRSYGSSLTVDEDHIRELRDKLSAIASLERKYKTNSAGLEAILAEYVEELSLFSDENRLEEVKEELAAIEKDLRTLATELSKKRKKAAVLLEKQISKDLKSLSMKDAAIKVQFEPAEIGPQGFERISFKFLSHKGQEPRSLSEAASGGELSRVMLVLKKAIKDKTGVNVLVFDEVDTGVSGGVARAVGELLKTLSKSSQVICITHLPQVASLADTHYLVSKAAGSPPKSSIKALEEDPRIEEIARMLAGYQITPASRESARELLSS